MIGQTNRDYNFMNLNIVQTVGAESVIFTKGTCVNCKSSIGAPQNIPYRCPIPPPLPSIKPTSILYMTKSAYLFILKID